MPPAPLRCRGMFSIIVNSIRHSVLRFPGGRPDNLVYNNADAGLAMMESFNADVRRNKFKRNKYGIRLSVGCADNVFRKNVIRKSTK